jgi:hypothetical protein
MIKQGTENRQKYFRMKTRELRERCTKIKSLMRLFHNMINGTIE